VQNIKKVSKKSGWEMEEGSQHGGGRQKKRDTNILPGWRPRDAADNGLSREPSANGLRAVIQQGKWETSARLMVKSYKIER